MRIFVWIMFIIIFHLPCCFTRRSVRALAGIVSEFMKFNRRVYRSGAGVDEKGNWEMCYEWGYFTGTSPRRPVILCYVYLFMLSRRRCVFLCPTPPPVTSRHRRSCTISRNFAPPAPPSSCSRYAPPPRFLFCFFLFCTTTGKTYGEFGDRDLSPKVSTTCPCKSIIKIPGTNGNRVYASWTRPWRALGTTFYVTNSFYVTAVASTEKGEVGGIQHPPTVNVANMSVW